MEGANCQDLFFMIDGQLLWKINFFVKIIPKKFKKVEYCVRNLLIFDENLIIVDIKTISSFPHIEGIELLWKQVERCMS